MVPLTCDRALRRSAIDLVELVTRQAYADGADVFSQSFDIARARYREHVA
jgi:hypothetical protein